MREPPVELDLSELRAVLLEAYAIDAAAFELMGLGYDSFAWVYRVTLVDGPPHFLKLRSNPLNEPGLRVPYVLRSSGVTAVVAPMATSSGELWTRCGPFTLVLYPFVNGASGMAAGLSDQQWRAYGATLRQIHAIALPPELALTMRRETFAPAGAADLRRLDAAMRGQIPDEPGAQGLATLWQERRGSILGLLERAETLGRELQARTPPLVLCHADIHTGNVLRDGDTGIWVVDWDEAMLAPKERDLMFVVGGISAALVQPRHEALCLDGYGPTAIDQAALAYYRYAWAVSDIAAFGVDVLFRPDLGFAARADALRMLARLFAPGEIVAIAQGA
jgi:spectinomycin phosphotransferase